MGRWEEFRQCPGCNYDFATGGGERSCSYYDCPYLPSELNVFCDDCRFDYFTMEGNPSCDDPALCEHGVDARANVENVHRWQEAQRHASA